MVLSRIRQEDEEEEARRRRRYPKPAPPEALAISPWIAEEENPIKLGAKTVLFAILTGIGIAIGFHIVQKKLKAG